MHASKMKSFESIYIESLLRERPDLPKQRKLFYGDVRSIDFFDEELSRLVLRYQTAGDAALSGTQFFSQNATELALALFHENPYGHFWDEWLQLVTDVPESDRHALGREFLEERRAEMDQIDGEKSQEIFAALGTTGKIEIHDLVSHMVSIKIQGDSSRFWSASLQTPGTSVLPFAYRFWNGNERTLLCTCDESNILISLVTS